TQLATAADIQSKAQYLGTGSFWIKDNLHPLHDAWFYVRSVNLVGKSAFAEASGQPSQDAEGYLEFFKGLITESYLGAELLKKIDLTEGNASKLEQFSKEWKDANDKWNAMWGVKIEQTKDGKYYVAGLGLSMEDTSDGKISQFLVAANRIAFIDPENGNTTPMFVAQGNQVFMNEALVKYLSATTITAPTITSGGNPPAFSLTPDGRLAARNADISGNINANSGTLSNVHILNNCQVDGIIRANQIEGDIAKTYVINGNSVYISPQMFDMNLVCMMKGFNIKLNGVEQSPVLSVQIAEWQTGSSWVGGSPGHGGGSYVPTYDRMYIKVYRLSAGTAATISGGEGSSGGGMGHIPARPFVVWMSKA
ncbi:TPA: DUF1983 domain-containing protein, partial [Salmonella enterica]|nr:DUF1983 domain-containing protein [Salmonella enterica]